MSWADIPSAPMASLAWPGRFTGAGRLSLAYKLPPPRLDIPYHRCSIIQ